MTAVVATTPRGVDPRLFHRGTDALRTELHTDVEAWAPYERELCGAGVPLPATWRSSWVRHHGETVWFATVCNRSDGACEGAVALQLTSTRALPGHFVVRGEHIGWSHNAAARSALLNSIAEWVAMCPRVLRLELETFSRAAADRESVGRELGDLGFRRSASARSYEFTSVVDLSGSEEALLAGFHSAARRHLRASAKNPDLEIRLLTEEHIPEISHLVEETRLRTSSAGGGQRPWAARLRLAAEQPELLIFVGLFRKSTGRLLSFASGHRNGDHVTYADAASTRSTDLRIPLGYAPVWEVIKWAKRYDARWFDFGGITMGSHAPDGGEDGHDPLGGISGFKRHFGGTDVRVSDEWCLEPHPARALVAHVVSAGATWLRAGWTQGLKRNERLRDPGTHRAGARITFT